MSFSVHDRNIQQLILEMCKVTKALHQLLYQVYSCNVVIIDKRSQSDFSVPQVNTVYFGQNSIRFLGPLLWNSSQLLREMLNLL